ncbi:unnamed protein product [Linum trigynum]|uniref:Uncharacterized protein n=1 Tax=Linum trigynum TaxID=586398 RepID=A0AAV2G1K4_9ROSI
MNVVQNMSTRSPETRGEAWTSLATASRTWDLYESMKNLTTSFTVESTAASLGGRSTNLTRSESAAAARDLVWLA